MVDLELERVRVEVKRIGGDAWRDAQGGIALFFVVTPNTTEDELDAIATTMATVQAIVDNEPGPPDA